MTQIVPKSDPKAAAKQAPVPYFQSSAAQSGAKKQGIALRLATPTAGVDEPVEKLVSEFQSDTAEIVGEADPIGARMTLFMLTLGFIVAVAWAAFAHLDRIVTANGTLISIQPTILVQPFDTSIVRSISVKEGDIVNAGRVLATLDPTFTAADVAQFEARLNTLAAQIERLEAENADRSYQIPAEKPSEAQVLQYSLWQQRRREYDASLRSRQEQISRLTVQWQAKERQIEQLKAQKVLINEIEEMRRKLAAAETGSRLNLLLAQRDSISVVREISLSEAEMIQLSHQIEGAKAELTVYIKQWSNQISNELARLRDERTSVGEQLNKARKRFDLVELATPVDAVVLEVAKRSVGSIVTAAEPLFRLVPLNAPLEIEANILAREMGFVKVGDIAEIKISAYNFADYGTLSGIVHTISEDSFKESSTGQVVYKTRVEIKENKMRNLPSSFRLIPGMPVAAEIKVGSRSVLSYFLSPITRGLEEGLREP